MATIRQKIAFAKIVENRGSVSKAMRESNYALATAKNPKNLTESAGFLELCDEIGLTDNFLTKALVADIKAKKGNRKPELELGYKVRGRLKDDADKAKTYNQFNFFEASQSQRAARRILNDEGAGETGLDRVSDSN